MFCSARAASAASGTMCSPVLSTLPENRPRRNPSARFCVSVSGNVMTTIFQPLKRMSRVCYPMVHNWETQPHAPATNAGGESRPSAGFGRGGDVLGARQALVEVSDQVHRHLRANLRWDEI